MTALRPERESGYQDPGPDDRTPYEQRPYGVSGAFQEPGGSAGSGAYEGAAQHGYAEQGASYDADTSYDGMYDALPPLHERAERPQYERLQQPLPGARQPGAGPLPPHASVPSQAAYEPEPIDEETMALRLPEAPQEAAEAAEAWWEDGGGGPISPQGGRAARRKAAKRHGNGDAHGQHGHPGHGRHSGAQEPEPAESGAVAPGSRMEARRAARARKPSMGVMASRAIGEVFITTGVLMLLFVTYQLWWTNYRAHQQAGSEASHLQEDWAEGKRAPGAFEPGQGFAIMDIPKLDVVVPIAEGINKQKVLDRGMVGHYGKDSIPTAMPDAKTGNFAVAGHRNTHGEPFRYINRLKPGDPIVVETQDMYYVYKMTSILPVTSPKNTSVLDPIPRGSGFTTAGRYITLTTCTPEFTSTYRMIVWGKMVEERPRSKGKPDALLR